MPTVWQAHYPPPPHSQVTLAFICWAWTTVSSCDNLNHTQLYCWLPKKTIANPLRTSSFYESFVELGRNARHALYRLVHFQEIPLDVSTFPRKSCQQVIFSIFPPPSSSLFLSPGLPSLLAPLPFNPRLCICLNPGTTEHSSSVSKTQASFWGA